MNLNELAAKLKEIQSRQTSMKRSGAKRRVISTTELVSQIVSSVNRAVKARSLPQVH